MIKISWMEFHVTFIPVRWMGVHEWEALSGWMLGHVQCYGLSNWAVCTFEHDQKLTRMHCDLVDMRGPVQGLILFDAMAFRWLIHGRLLKLQLTPFQNKKKTTITSKKP